jgi:hypothetical protein
MIRVPNVRAEAQYVFRSRGLHVTAAQEGEPILVTVCVVVVFPARGLDRLEEVDCLYTWTWVSKGFVSKRSSAYLVSLLRSHPTVHDNGVCSHLPRQATNICGSSCSHP